jgi:hypothetical protein
MKSFVSLNRAEPGEEIVENEFLDKQDEVF